MQAYKHTCFSISCLWRSTSSCTLSLSSFSMNCVGLIYTMKKRMSFSRRGSRVYVGGREESRGERREESTSFSAVTRSISANDLSKSFPTGIKCRFQFCPYAREQNARERKLHPRPGPSSNHANLCQHTSASLASSISVLNFEIYGSCKCIKQHINHNCSTSTP